MKPRPRAFVMDVLRRFVAARSRASRVLGYIETVFEYVETRVLLKPWTR